MVETAQAMRECKVLVDSTSLVCVAFAIAAFTLTASAQTRPAADRITITTLSSRPTMISGDDILVQITLPRVASRSRVRMTLNGRDVAASLHEREEPQTFVALLKGLTIGHNVLAVTAGTVHATLDLASFPTTGPIFSGPHQSPFICETQSFQIQVIAKTLGPATDADCSAPTVVAYVYKSASGTFKSGPPPSHQRHRANDNIGQSSRQLHRPARNRNHQPSHLPTRDALRSVDRCSIESMDSWAWMERKTHLRIRRRRQSWISPGSGCGNVRRTADARHAERHLVGARIRRRRFDTEHECGHEQHRGLGRNRDDGAVTLSCREKHSLGPRSESSSGRGSDNTRYIPTGIESPPRSKKTARGMSRRTSSSLSSTSSTN
jgi:hypothetical protein